MYFSYFNSTLLHFKPQLFLLLQKNFVVYQMIFLKSTTVSKKEWKNNTVKNIKRKCASFKSNLI